MAILERKATYISLILCLQSVRAMRVYTIALFSVDLGPKHMPQILQTPVEILQDFYQVM